MTKEEAIEKVRGMKLSPGKDAELIIALHTLIPELREPEDERIRKSLVGIVEQFMADERKEKTLAWLERQKEHNFASAYKAVVEEGFVVLDKQDYNYLLERGEPTTPEEKIKHPLYVEGFEAGKKIGAQYESVFGKQQKEQKSIGQIPSEFALQKVINVLTIHITPLNEARGCGTASDEDKQYLSAYVEAREFLKGLLASSKEQK